MRQHFVSFFLQIGTVTARWVLLLRSSHAKKNNLKRDFATRIITGTVTKIWGPFFVAVASWSKITPSSLWLIRLDTQLPLVVVERVGVGRKIMQPVSSSNNWRVLLNREQAAGT